MFKKMHLTEARTHDWALVNAGQRMIDTHFIFPLMHLDPADPRNYYFAPSDEIIRLCRECGTNVYYRLGTSIEHSGRIHFNSSVPPDFEKYAEVCAGIVRHYTRGWADGFHWDIQYWEIWNEPELGSKAMWDGPLEEFFRLFITVFKRLKSEFPELKIGGPAFCGCSEETIMPFLDACRKENVRIDFFSWHCYSADPEQILAQPGRVRKILDERGWNDTELHLNEWHYIRSWEGLHSKVTEESFRKHMMPPSGMFEIDSAAFNLAVLCGWHDTPLDAAYYYGCGDATWGFRNLYKGLNKNYYSMVMFGDLVHEYPNRISVQGASGSVRALGALSSDGRRGVLLLSDYCGEQMEIPVRISGMENAVLTARILDNSSNLEGVPCRMENGSILLKKKEPGSAAFQIFFERTDR